MNSLHCNLAKLANEIFASSADALFLVDANTNQIIDANPAASRRLGKPHAELLGQTIDSFLISGLTGKSFAARAVGSQSDTRSSDEYQLQRPGRPATPVCVAVSCVGDSVAPIVLVMVQEIPPPPSDGSVEHLRSSEERYRDLVETTNDLVWSLDADGRFTYVHRRGALAVYGREPEELIGKHFVDFVAPEFVSREVAAFQDLRGKTTNGYESVALRKDGSRVRLRVNAVPIFNAAGQCIGSTGTATDITKWKESEERYRHFWQRNLAGTVRASLDGRILDCNDSFAKLFGFTSRAEMFARSTTELYFDLGVREEFLARLREQQFLTNYEMHMRRADGTPIWVLESVSLLVENGEEILEGTLIDITDRKQTEEALRLSEARYRTLVDHLDQGIFLKDRELRYVTANPVFCSAVRKTEAELRGKTIAELYPNHPLTVKSREIERQVLTEGRSIETEDRIKAGRKERLIRINRTPVKNSQGDVVGVLGICWDVTDHRRLEFQLRHMQKMDAIGQLAGGIAHDFNNLLTIMLGNLSYILTQKVDLKSGLELIQNAERAGLRAAELTQTLLGFSRGSASTAAPCNLNHAIDEVVRLTRSTLPANITIEVHRQSDLWSVQADPGQMGQVLTNLALNSRDAMPAGGRITFETSHFIPDAEYLASHLEARPGEFVRLRVADTGPGIPAELRQRIFEPFFTTKAKGKGTGLGLAIVFSIVKQHDGWIVCESNPGRGAAFDIYLPRGPIPVVLAPPPRAMPSGSRETILVVDDEPMIRQLARTILSRAGYEVLLAENGAVAIDLLRRRSKEIALVVLDAVMPQLSGRDTLRELAAVAPDVSVLFSSGYSTEQMNLHEFRQVRAFLPKPYRAEELIQKVTEILGQTRRAAGTS